MKIHRPLLTGLAIAIGLAVGSPAYAGDVDDARREATIWTSYAFNPHLKALDISVEVTGDTATLTGTVQEGVEKDLAEQIALGADGIAKVDNKLIVDAAYVPKPRPAPPSGRDFATTVEDATITASVKSKLMWNDHTDGLEIDVDTMNGQVTLNGTADTPAAKDLATRLARNTDGVRTVSNNLTIDTDQPVKETTGTTQPISDAWVTAKVKSTLANSRWVEASDIDVDTKEGVVTLKGTVDSPAEKDLAIELSQNVRGVRKVDGSGLHQG